MDNTCNSRTLRPQLSKCLLGILASKGDTLHLGIVKGNPKRLTWR